MSRWLPIVGGISLNLALGSLYAWSVFVLPLEKEFGWSRTQTSWVYTIAIVCFAASFIVAGKLVYMAWEILRRQSMSAGSASGKASSTRCATCFAQPPAA